MTEAMTDLEIIIQKYQKVLDITSTNYLNRADWLYNLESEYENRY